MTASAVQAYWSAHPCGSEWTSSDQLSRAYFDELEAYRYVVEPMIRDFARFDDARDKKVLEVGIGAATDFVQWARAGAHAYGVDLTPVSIDHARRRLAFEGLSAAGLSVANCECLPWPSDTFDIVYSWGVIHHSTGTQRALSEIVRVCRPGGSARIMIYNRRSLVAWYLWLRYALMRGRVGRSLSSVLAEHMESPGTQAFSTEEARAMLAGQPVRDVRIRTVLTRDDRLAAARLRPLRWIGDRIAGLLGDRAGWFMLIDFTRLDAPVTA